MQFAWSFGVGLITFLWLAATDATTGPALLIGIVAAAITYVVYFYVKQETKN